MPFEEITDPSAVRSAIEEYRTLGQTRFLKKYAFGASRGWMLRDTDGEEYDAKAILGAAHGYQHPALGHLPHGKFYGGVPTARKLRELGFAVTEPTRRRNPVWTRDELILALDLYMRHRPSFPDDKHPCDRTFAALEPPGGNHVGGGWRRLPKREWRCDEAAKLSPL